RVHKNSQFSPIAKVGVKATKHGIRQTNAGGRASIRRCRMCDYSLELYGSRPAREGELYVTTRFPSGSIGFASPGDPRTPVCVQCDTKVVLTDIPTAMQVSLAVGPEIRTTFAQRETGLYRDGLRLADGRFVSLQDLPAGVGAYIPTLLEREGAT